MKPQIMPTITPQRADCTKRLRMETAVMASLVVMTGFTMNLIPSSRVIHTEKLPIAAEGSRLDTQLPTKVKHRTATIITIPLRMSRFLFFP